MREFSNNEIVHCEVSGITNYGVFVKIDDEYSGLIHISEISNKFVNNLEKLYMVGDVIEAKVISVDESKKQVSLSIKNLDKKSKRKKKIEETGDGFLPLKEKLDYWISEKMKELEKN